MDIGLITLSPGMYGLGVPSKVYNILSAGKPILFVGDKDAEIARYIHKYDVGWSFTWDNTTALMEFLNGLSEADKNIIHKKGQNARLLVEKKFTKGYIIDQYCEIIQS
jgi:hypothetical protein